MESLNTAMERHASENIAYMHAPILPVTLFIVPRRRNATARIRNATIQVFIPQRWKAKTREEIARQLAQRVQKEFALDHQLLHNDTNPRLTLTNKQELEEWVYQWNAETFNLPLKGVRIGTARYTHLAQMNLGSNTMTVSKYCLIDVPKPAFTYLITHELAHMLVPNHSKAFWSEVKKFVPNLKAQRRLISAVHHIRIYEADLKTQAKIKPFHPNRHPEPQTKPSFLTQLKLRLF